MLLTQARECFLADLFQQSVANNAVYHALGATEGEGDLGQASGAGHLQQCSCLCCSPMAFPHVKFFFDWSLAARPSYASQEEDADLGKRRRQSAAGLRGAEQPLSPVMVAHVVDALFERSVPQPSALSPLWTRLWPMCHARLRGKRGAGGGGGGGGQGGPRGVEKPPTFSAPLIDSDAG